MGFGMIIGPPMGSIIYGYYGYEWTFVAFGILIFLDLVMCFFLIPNKLNKAIQIRLDLGTTMVSEKVSEDATNKAMDREVLLDKHNENLED